MNNNEEPLLVLETDDSMSMTSLFSVKVYRPLKIIELEHTRQNYGGTERITLYPDQIDVLCAFLQQSKAWIDSGYKEELKPLSFNEIEDRKK
jgi:hypothetical protein